MNKCNVATNYIPHINHKDEYVVLCKGKGKTPQRFKIKIRKEPMHIVQNKIKTLIENKESLLNKKLLLQKKLFEEVSNTNKKKLKENSETINKIIGDIQMLKMSLENLKGEFKYYWDII